MCNLIIDGTHMNVDDLNRRIIRELGSGATQLELLSLDANDDDGQTSQNLNDLADDVLSQGCYELDESCVFEPCGDDDVAVYVCADHLVWVVNGDLSSLDLYDDGEILASKIRESTPKGNWVTACERLAQQSYYYHNCQWCADGLGQYVFPLVKIEK